LEIRIQSDESNGIGSKGLKLRDFIELFGDFTDVDYLEAHYPRFCTTKRLAEQNWNWGKADILDVGAHWLHQSVLFALDGHHVTAADFSTTLEHPAVKKTASRFNIDLLVYPDLSSQRVFDELEEDSMDVILFSEILEHITFNPVDMWKAFYRILRPGGRIIVTTPNYYCARNFFPAVLRLLSGRGAGISVSDIIQKNTYSPHWKEFSKKELAEYFESLSPDFVVQKQQYISEKLATAKLNWKGILVHDTKNILPAFRSGIYAEIDLVRKNLGITIKPEW